MNQQHEEAEGLNPVAYMRQGTNCLYLLASAWAITIYLPLRYGSGKEHTGIRGVMGFGFPLLFMLFVQEPSVFLIWPIYFVGLLIHRFGHWRAYQRRELIHTQYSGYPWAAHLLFRHQDEVQTKTLLEPMLAVIIGFALSPLGGGIAVYYIFGAGAMSVKQLFDNLASRQRLDQLNDAMIENDYLMSQSRALRRMA